MVVWRGHGLLLGQQRVHWSGQFEMDGRVFDRAGGFKSAFFIGGLREWMDIVFQGHGTVRINRPHDSIRNGDALSRQQAVLSKTRTRRNRDKNDESRERSSARKVIHKNFCSIDREYGRVFWWESVTKGHDSDRLDFTAGSR